MKLTAYEWSYNPRGLHNSGPFRPLDVSRYTRLNLGWAKLVAGGDEYADEAEELVAAGITPIVRIERTQMGAMSVPSSWYDTYQAYIDAGVRWFELYDEPNLDYAWPHDADGEPVMLVSWQNVDDCIAPLMENWLSWAERLLEMGAYPAFPALAETGVAQRATVYWYDALLNYLRRHHLDRFLAVINNGLWCATHPYLLNHFYQEPPGGPDHIARPHYQQSADEDGWHFEYPYDPILQRHDPGRTVFGATSQTPYGDPQGLVAAGEAFNQLLYHRFEANPVPVVGTAGGISPIPHDAAEAVQPDEHYPPYTRDTHAEATLAMFNWIAEEGPPWFFGLTLSSESDYFDAQGPVPVVYRLESTLPLLKEGMPGVTRPPLVPPEPERVEDAADVAAPSVAEPAAEAIPGWISDPDSLEVEPEPAAERMPDWLALDDLEPEETTAAFDAWVEEQAAAHEAATATTVEEDLPAWLEETDLEIIEGTAVEVGVAEDAVGLEMPPLPESPAEEETLVGEAAADLPPWLDEQKEEPGEAVAEEEIAPPSPEPAIEEVSLAGEDMEDIPPWLFDLVPESAEATDEVVESEEAPAEDLPAWLDPTDIGTAIDSLPDIASGDEDGTGLDMPPPPDLPSEEALVGETADELPDWLDDADVGVAVPVVPEPILAEAAPQAVVLPPQMAGRVPEVEIEVPAEEERPEPQPIPVSAATIVDAALPENHWLMLAGSVDPRWFFAAGIRYWDAFHPTLVHGGEDLSLIPEHETVAITILVPAKEADLIERQIQQVRPDAQLDVVICGTIEELTAELNWRVATGRRFG